MIHLSILDEDFADMTSLQIRVNELEEENKHLKKQVDWYEDMMFDWKRVDEYHAATRSKRLDDVYYILYGDSPVADVCDNRLGFFLELDMICHAILKCKWLIKIFRWFGYKPVYIEELHKQG